MRLSRHYRATAKKCEAETDRVPHVVTSSDKGVPMSTYSTTDRHRVQRCRYDVKALDEGRMRFDPLPDLIEREKNMRALVAADDERQVKIQAIRDRYDMDTLDEQSDELGNSICEREREVMNTPAPDLAALRWKLDYITEEAKAEDGCLPTYTNEFVGQMLADIAALMPVGA